MSLVIFYQQKVQEQLKLALSLMTALSLAGSFDSRPLLTTQGYFAFGGLLLFKEDPTGTSDVYRGYQGATVNARDTSSSMVMQRVCW